MGVPVYSESPGGFATVCGVLFTAVILLFGSGIPTAEGKNLRRYYTTPEAGKQYEAYRNQTSPLVPIPHRCYRQLPLLLKRLFCCEFKMYELPPQQIADVHNERTEVLVP